MLKILFWSAWIFIFYAYFGYPISLLILSIFRKVRIDKAQIFPEISLIITAYNEERRIREKLENSLSIDYPKDRFQIILVSDGSEDRTIEIAKEFEQNGVELISLPCRIGKENAQAEAVKKAKGKILIFSDVSTIIEKNGICEIVANFNDPCVGCVSSEDKIICEDGSTSGEGFYVRYEMWLRRLESRVNTLVGLSGSFFAARREFCKNFSATVPTDSDFKTILNCVKKGSRGVIDPDVIGYYRDVVSQTQEFERKVRTVLRGITGFAQHVQYLNIFKYGFFSYQIFCHKLLRWIVPFLLLIVLFTNILLLSLNSFYRIILIFQTLFYTVAILGWMRESFANSNLFIKIPMYFISVNFSVLVAWWRFIKGDKIIIWTPSKR